eukprot:jgi/Galph1/4023/GphlegSOOS_G2662.1
MASYFGTTNFYQASQPAERNQEATLYVGNLDERVSEELLWELMVQVGPVKHVYIPRDRITGQTQGYGFVEFKNEIDAIYATKVLNMVRLYAKPLRLQQASTDKRNMDIGANLFVGNLSQEVDEKLLYDTFSAFGAIIETPHIMRDPDTGESKGYGFVKFDSFEANTKERHGSQAERILAARARAVSANALLRPHGMFSVGPQSGLAYSGFAYPGMMPPGYPAGAGIYSVPNTDYSAPQQ